MWFNIFDFSLSFFLRVSGMPTSMLKMGRSLPFQALNHSNTQTLKHSNENERMMTLFVTHQSSHMASNLNIIILINYLCLKSTLFK